MSQGEFFFFCLLLVLFQVIIISYFAWSASEFEKKTGTYEKQKITLLLLLFLVEWRFQKKNLQKSRTLKEDTQNGNVL